MTKNGFIALFVCTLSCWMPNVLAVSSFSAIPVKQVAAVQKQPAPVSKTNLLLDKERLRDAQQQLLGRPELAQRPLYVLDKVDFFDGTRPRIELIVAHRSGKDVPLNIYTFENGTWRAEPIEQDYSDNYIAKHQMQLDDTDWAQVADVARVWQEKAREVKAVETEPYYISLVWLPPQRKRFWHTATLEAVGKQYYLSLHENGTVWEWKRPAAEKE